MNDDSKSLGVQFGFGTYRLKGEDAYRATLYALKSGVNHIDSAPLYGNIEEVGRAIKGCGRNGIIVTAKVSRDSLKTHDVVGSFKRTM